MFILAFFLIILTTTILLGKNLTKQRHQAGIRGWVRDNDLDGKGKRIYRDEQTGVTCKPDVVVHDGVIEYKSASVDKPRWVDLLQLAIQMNAAGLQHGELRYAQDKRFSFNHNSAEMRAASKKALDIVNRMRWHLKNSITPKGTPTQRRCAVCVFIRQCPEAVK